MFTHMRPNRNSQREQFIRHSACIMSSQPATARTDEGTSSRSVSVHGAQVPVDWLVMRHDAAKYPGHTLSTQSEVRAANRNLAWNRQRDQWIAAAAAGMHLAMFSFNLAFWGTEGMPPDRYNPPNLRCVSAALVEQQQQNRHVLSMHDSAPRMHHVSVVLTLATSGPQAADVHAS